MGGLPEVGDTEVEAISAFSVILNRGIDLMAYKTNETGIVK